MRHVTVIVMLLLALLSQALAMPGAGAGAADPAHAALHWQGERHHHHDDGSQHVDDSAESDQHLVADQAYGAVALLPAMQTTFFQPGSTLALMASESSATQPFLDGLLRPPRPMA